MTQLRVGVIGTGDPAKGASRMGYAMAYQHADAYASLDNCQLVACADIKQENAEAFAKHYQLPNFYLSHQEMLTQEDLDIVSICVWPHLHARLVLDAIDAGVRAIHSEKPMADTWGDARRMVLAAEKNSVQLTFNHQRRFGKPFSMAKDLLKSGQIGDLLRLEAACGDIYDYGTHYIDMFGFYNQDLPAKWVQGQIDYRTKNLVFGAMVENQATALWEYQNGVFGFIATGLGSRSVGVHNRLIGTEGVIEVGADNVHLRIQRNGKSWETIDTQGEHLHGPGFIERGIADLIDSFHNGTEPELSGRRALNATEIIFSIYESSRRRSRIDLPLDIDDNPLVEMVESGALQPE